MRDRIKMHLYKCNKQLRSHIMEKTGIIKEIDSLGRLHIPKEMFRFNIQFFDEI